jgi:K+-transporting ATPase ATPase C chain
MRFSTIIRQHWAALRALLVLTVIVGGAYPLFIWLAAQLPGLQDKANGSIVESGGKPVGSSLIGQMFTDADGNPLPQYLQSRPSAAGDGYDPMATSASNLGPESIVDVPDKPSLLTLVCTRSADVAKLDGVNGARPFCTGDGVGAVLSVIGPRDASGPTAGQVTRPTRVVSVNEACNTTKIPFLATYEGVRVECAQPGEDYSIGQLVPIHGAASTDPQVPADAVTASGSGLDPDISPAYAGLQVNRIAEARGISAEQVRGVIAAHTDGRALGFMGEPSVNVLAVNIALDEQHPGG